MSEHMANWLILGIAAATFTFLLGYAVGIRDGWTDCAKEQRRRGARPADRGSDA